VHAELQEIGHAEVVVLDSEDTDVYVQASYVSNEVAGDVMIRRKDHLVRCSTMLPADVAKVIIPLHGISGSDHTSSFFGHGKKKLLRKSKKDPQAMDILRDVGESLQLNDGTKSELKAFVLWTIYDENGEISCGEARASKWHKMLKKKSTARQYFCYANHSTTVHCSCGLLVNNDRRLLCAGR